MGLIDLLSPAVFTAANLKRTIDGGDMLLSLHGRRLPDDVKVAWLDHLRPALDRWRSRLEKTK